MADFYHAFNRPPTVPAAVGSPIKDVHVLKRDERGNKYLEKVGEKDQQAYIDSFEHECRIDTILKRFENGDISVINQRETRYMDTTTYPQDLRGVVDVISTARAFFDSLPDEKRGSYVDFDDFLKYSDFSVIQKEVESEVKSDE